MLLFATLKKSQLSQLFYITKLFFCLDSLDLANLRAGTIIFSLPAAEISTIFTIFQLTFIWFRWFYSTRDKYHLQNPLHQNLLTNLDLDSSI